LVQAVQVVTLPVEAVLDKIQFLILLQLSAAALQEVLAEVAALNRLYLALSAQELLAKVILVALHL
jgi:hypothetical protein